MVPHESDTFLHCIIALETPALAYWPKCKWKSISWCHSGFYIWWFPPGGSSPQICTCIEQEATMYMRNITQNTTTAQNTQNRKQNILSSYNLILDCIGVWRQAGHWWSTAHAAPTVFCSFQKHHKTCLLLEFFGPQKIKKRTLSGSQ
jgi:hypothetical protein